MYNILVVDDNIDTHTLLKYYLDDRFNLSSVFNGIEAVNIVNKIEFDVILMDINMPEMNGIEASKIIHNKFPNIPIISISAYDNNHGDYKFDCYVTKPFKCNVLLSALSKCLKTELN